MGLPKRSLRLTPLLYQEGTWGAPWGRTCPQVWEDHQGFRGARDPGTRGPGLGATHRLQRRKAGGGTCWTPARALPGTYLTRGPAAGALRRAQGPEELDKMRQASTDGRREVGPERLAVPSSGQWNGSFPRSGVVRGEGGSGSLLRAHRAIGAQRFMAHYGGCEPGDPGGTSW
jgi:hypothetical protein